MVKAVIFDLDDTLISEKEYIESGYRHVAQIIERGFNLKEKQVNLDLIQLFKEDSHNVFNRFFDKKHIEYSEDTITYLVKEFRGHYPNVKFYDDVMPCLTELKSLGIKTGIITDGYAQAQRLKLEVIEASKYFDEIIVTDEIGRDYWKPHPRAFELIRERLSINYDEMIYVGDNPEKDFYIKSIYPIKTARVLRDGFYLDKCYLNGVREDFSIGKLTRIIDIIDKKL